MRALELNYSRSKWCHLANEVIEPICSESHETIADLNIALVQALAELLGINSVRFVRATDMALESTGASSIIEILTCLNAKTYITGSGAGTLRHFHNDEFAERGINVRFIDSDFVEYEQLFGAFEPNLSIVDPLFNVGPAFTKELLEVHVT